MFSHVLLEDLSSLLQPRLYSLQGWWCQPATQTSDSFLWFVSHCMICLLELTEPIFDMPCHRTLESIKHNKCPKFEYTKKCSLPQTTGCGFHSSSSGSTAPRSHVPSQNKEQRVCMSLHLCSLKPLSVCCAYIYTHTPYTYTYIYTVHIHIHIYRYIDI